MYVITNFSQYDKPGLDELYEIVKGLYNSRERAEKEIIDNLEYSIEKGYFEGPIIKIDDDTWSCSGSGELFHIQEVHLIV
jgi:hypothetical protein